MYNGTGLEQEGNPTVQPRTHVSHLFIQMSGHGFKPPGWHYCYTVRDHIWINPPYPCPNCSAVDPDPPVAPLPSTHQPYSDPNMYNPYPGFAPPSHYPNVPTLPSNAVAPAVYSTSSVASHHQYGLAPTSPLQGAPSSPSPVSPTQAKQASRWVCNDCPAGQSVFSREPDLTRHKKTVHGKEQMLSEGGGFDCPHPDCERKGRKAFTRYDHFIEHRRGFHKEIIEKRGQSSRRSKS